MNRRFRKSFARDLKKIKAQDILDRINQVIEEVTAATDLKQVGDLKKMSGTAHYYRIRIGDLRIGIKVEKDTVEFVRCLPRRDLYKYFP